MEKNLVGSLDQNEINRVKTCLQQKGAIMIQDTRPNGRNIPNVLNWPWQNGDKERV